METPKRISGKKRAFLFYEDWKTAAARLMPDERLLFYETLTDYAFTGKLPDNLPYTLQVMFTLVTPFIDSDKAKWEETRKQRSEAGRKSGEVRRTNKTNLCSTKRTDNVDEDVNENENENENEKAYVDESASVNATPQVRADFTPPTRQEVEDYIKQMGYTCSADAFYDYYAARGWMMGNNRIADWRAAVRNWQQREPEMNCQTIKNGGTYGNYRPSDKKAADNCDGSNAMSRLAAQESA